jgi:phosphatidylglycerophosphate synthase
MATAAVLLPLAVVYARRVARYSEQRGELDAGVTVAVFLVGAPLLVFLASRYLYSRFTSPAYYGVSGGSRWALFGAMLALLGFLASYVLPLPNRDGDLVPYVLLRLLDFVVIVLAMLVSYRVAFRGVPVDSES